MSVIGPLRKEWLVHLNTQERTAKPANTRPPGGFIPCNICTG